MFCSFSKLHSICIFPILDPRQDPKQSTPVQPKSLGSTPFLCLKRSRWDFPVFFLINSFSWSFSDWFRSFQILAETIKKYLWKNPKEFNSFEGTYNVTRWISLMEKISWVCPFNDKSNCSYFYNVIHWSIEISWIILSTYGTIPFKADANVKIRNLF